MSATRREFTITCLRRHEDGYWTARVTVDGRTYDVDRAYGSWCVSGGKAKPARELMPLYAAAIQEKVRRLERSERSATT